MSFLKEDLLFIRVTPNAAQTKISGKFVDEKNQEYLKINVAAVPEDGKANEELIRFLSKLLKIPKTKIEVIRGETARMKVVKLGASVPACVTTLSTTCHPALIAGSHES